MTATRGTNRWSVGQRSETGYVRTENQDRMSWVRTPVADVFIVLDGMGGHAGGGIAAELAVQVLQRHFETLTSLASVEAVLRSAFADANAAVYARSHSGDPATRGMGTTAVVMLIAGWRLMLAHVGDSRAYLLTRSGALQRLTKDHSRIQRLVDTGLLTDAQAATHPDAGILERAIGHAPQVEVEVGQWLRVRAGETCLLCSDGLCGYIGDADIAAIMRSDRTPQELADELVRLALERGGADNVTVQVVRRDRVHVLAPWRRLRARFTPGAAAIAAPAALVGVLGAGWLASLPTQLESERETAANTVALRSEVQQDRKVADERYESTKQELAAIRTRLDQLGGSGSRANASSPPVTPHAQKPPSATGKKEGAAPLAGRRHVGGPSHTARAQREAAVADAASAAGTQPASQPAPQPGPESAPHPPVADGPDPAGS
ncbi:PP2C family protein-serine/threonine phosphatase [Trinickia violacea]|nr:protein phosphatase 2C domain-containing protein [Trinickia violacea]